MRAKLAIAAIWLGSLGATWVVAHDRPSAAAAAPPSGHRVAVPQVSCPSLDSIRAVVRDALPPGEPRGEPTAAALARDETAADVASDDTTYLRARDVLERDLADGGWSESDRDRLNAALPELTRDQAAELMAILFPKLNSGEVRSEIDGAPL